MVHTISSIAWLLHMSAACLFACMHVLDICYVLGRKCVIDSRVSVSDALSVSLVYTRPTLAG